MLIMAGLLVTSATVPALSRDVPLAKGDKSEAGDKDAKAEKKAEKKKAAEDEEEPEEEEKIRKVRPNRHITIRARSVKLKESSRKRLLSIAKRYHGETKRKLVITGGDRTPHRQAQLMYRKLKKGDNLLKLYTKARLVLQVMKVYENGQDKNHSRRKIIRAMGKTIAKQVERGEFISRHLAFSAADVRSRGLKDKHVKALKAAVKAEAGARLVDERKSEAPHFHLSL